MKRLVVLAITGGFSLTCFGQIGNGWTAAHPRISLQQRGTGPVYQSNNGIETFGITNAVREGDERAEQRVWDDYSSGSHQFQGDLKVVSLGGSGINLKQTFESKQGAWFLCTVDNANHGTLRDHKSKTILATNVIGRTVRLNTVHDMDNGKFYVYVDGVLKETLSSAKGSTYNDKYGTYRSASGHGPVTAEWSNVHFWEGGTVDNAAETAATTANPPSTTAAPEVAAQASPPVTAALPELTLASPEVPAPAAAPAPVTTEPPTATATPAPAAEAPVAVPAPAPAPAPATTANAGGGYVLTDAERQFLDQLVNALKNNDAGWIADHMVFPLSIVASDEISIIGSKERFKKTLTTHLTDDLRAKIVDAAQGPLARNWQGIVAKDRMLTFSQYRRDGEVDYAILSLGDFAFQPNTVPKR